MDPIDIVTILVKEGHELTDYDFYILMTTHPYQTEYLAITGLTFEDNIVHLN